MVEVGLIEARVGLIVVEVHVAKMRADVTIGIVSAIVEGAEDDIKLETERDCAEMEWKVLEQWRVLKGE